MRVSECINIRKMEHAKPITVYSHRWMYAFAGPAPRRIDPILVFTNVRTKRAEIVRGRTLGVVPVFGKLGRGFTAFLYVEGGGHDITAEGQPRHEVCALVEDC